MIARRPRSLLSLRSHDVTELRGVGKKRAEALYALDIYNIHDLLTYYPRRYIDRTEQHSIAESRVGDTVTVFAVITSVSSVRMRNGRTMITVVARDNEAAFTISFFNQPWRAKQLHEGDNAIFSGKLSEFRKRLQMTNPLVDLVGNKTGRIIAIYPQSEKAAVTSWEIGSWIEEALDRAGELIDMMDADQLDKLELLSLTRAMRNVHMPASMAVAYAARKRLAFDELLRLQTLLTQRKRYTMQNEQGIVHDVDGERLQSFLAQLSFAPTAAQMRAIEEMRRDMALAHPMHRLLQGDVGSGKTLVALAGFLVAAQGGQQSAFLAPTEVLAEQHAQNVRAALATTLQRDEGTLFGARPLRVELLTSKTTASQRRQLHEALRLGDVDVLIGTHALLTDEVQFQSLGFVVIDEQHRFGVEQRARLREKAANNRLPDVLVMTATPIPRTAAMTVYGDLDVSVLDELPPGRTPIVTRWAKTEREGERAWKRVRDEVSAGRQAYVVCPLVEASERVQAKSAKLFYDELVIGHLKGLRVGILHGQLRSAEKEQTMQAFRAGELDAIVATTVIEVGVDVPNATVMVIQDAGRFGIAQLHQLRGRVGRGAKQSFCYFLETNESEEIAALLNALVESTDGFHLADVDLELRGPGSVLGARQKGISDLKLASLRTSHRALVKLARKTAQEIVDTDPTLARHEILRREVEFLIEDAEAEYLFKN